MSPPPPPTFCESLFHGPRLLNFFFHSPPIFICIRERAGQAVGKFSENAHNTSSTVRELLAVQYCLQSLTSLLSNEAVRVYVDNFSASRILTAGSARPHLQAIALNIFQACLCHNIKLTWVPRELNTIADHYSKLRDTDDWSIDHQTFQDIDDRFGKFTIDRFADNVNTKLPRFNSKYFCPNTGGVDAFTEDWAHENNWVCPPVSLIGSVFRHMRRCKASGTVFVPIWKSSYFWPLLYLNGLHLAPFVVNYDCAPSLHLQGDQECLWENQHSKH